MSLNKRERIYQKEHDTVLEPREAPQAEFSGSSLIVHHAGLAFAFVKPEDQRRHSNISQDPLFKNEEKH